MMRRKDREVTGKSKIDEIIRGCHCCRLGFIVGDEVYIVPLNFGFVSADGGGTFYFHGAKAGRKYRLLQKNPVVTFELDRDYRLNGGNAACDYSCHFQSVMGRGRAAIVTEPEEMLFALNAIMEQAVRLEAGRTPPPLEKSAVTAEATRTPAKKSDAGISPTATQSPPPRTDWSYQPEMLAATCVFKVEITELSCKEHE